MTIEEKKSVFKKKINYENSKFEYPNREFDMDELSVNPTFFILKLGFSCKSRCVHCFTENKRVVPDLTIEEIKSTIDSIEKKGAIVVVTGGEPTDRPDLIDILKYLREKRFVINLETNGIMFNDKHYLNEISPYFDFVFMPIHSSDPEVHDSITRVSGSWEKTIKAFKNIRRSPIYLTTQTVINKLNYKTILSTFDMIQKMAPMLKMTLTFPHPIAAAHSIEVVPKYSEIKDFIQPVLKKYGRLIHTHYIPKCYLFPYQNLVTNVDDQDRSGTEKPGTDYIDSSWKRLDYGVFRKESRIKTIRCFCCSFDKECIGVLKEYSELYRVPDLVPIIYGE